MATAKEGDKISFSKEGINYEGVVSVVRDNSVIVDYGYSKKETPLRTIVNHKNYKIIKES